MNIKIAGNWDAAGSDVIRREPQHSGCGNRPAGRVSGALLPRTSHPRSVFYVSLVLHVMKNKGKRKKKKRKVREISSTHSMAGVFGGAKGAGAAAKVTGALPCSLHYDWWLRRGCRQK